MPRHKSEWKVFQEDLDTLVRALELQNFGLGLVK